MGLQGWSRRPSTHCGDSRHPDPLATHTACPAFSQKPLPNSQAAHEPGDRAQIREGKNISFVPQNGCPFPQAVTILPLFPLKQPIEKPTVFTRRWGL